MSTSHRPRIATAASAALVLGLAAVFPAHAAQSSYQVRNLVSDGGTPAEHKDRNLVNAWGIAFNKAGPAWIADNGTDVSTLYDGNGEPVPLVVSIPKGKPTGIVANETSRFIVKKGGKSAASLFLFASEAGAITGWSPTVDRTHAILAFSAKDGAIYKGLALATNGRNSYLYATDFHNGKVDVLDDTFKLTRLSGDFKDANIPKGFAPFGIRNIGGKIYVTFAKQDKAREDDVHGKGLGFVDVFDRQGHLLKRLVSHGVLNAPWGLALAPANFGPVSKDLLVGNFGDGALHAYDPATGNFQGSLKQTNGKPIVIDGLWGLSFGNGTATQPRNTLFFAAGPADESHGLYGRVDVAPGK